MPVLDGYAAARQIRNLPGPASRIPIIALTASAFKEDRERAQQAGMDDFVSKPFRVQELIAKCLMCAKPNSKAPRGPEPEPDSERYSPEFLESLMRIFLETAPPIFGDLMEAFENEDWEEAIRLAHWLQGGASRVVNPTLQAQLRHVEAVSGSSHALSTAEIEALRESFQLACENAESWLRDRESAAHVTA
jgi:two-component system sensor histidine kinase/response regulator